MMLYQPLPKSLDGLCTARLAFQTISRIMRKYPVLLKLLTIIRIPCTRVAMKMIVLLLFHESYGYGSVYSMVYVSAPGPLQN